LIVDTLLYNGKVFVDGELIKAGIAINDEKIFRIAKTPNLPEASKRINLKGNVVIPGLVDVHVHLRDEGKAYKEDFYTGTMAAAAGGVTTVLDMPNNEPVTMSGYALEERISLTRGQIFVNVGFYSALPQSYAEIRDILEKGALAFKLFLNKQIGGVDIDSDEALLETFHILSRAGAPVAVHAEDRRLIEEKKRKLQRSGRNDFKAFYEVHSSKAEENAVKRMIRLTEQSEVQTHFCHLSSKKGLNHVKKAKEKGLFVTCEVTPHHLFLSSADLEKYGGFAVVTPSLKTRRDVEALWHALKAGWIDIIASDHAPHTLREKTADSVWDVKPGIAGIETLLPLMLNEVNRGRLTLAELVRLTSENPAKIFRINLRGLLKEGFYADLTVVDMKKTHQIDASKFYSKAKFSPFDGWKLRGKPVKTFVNGELVMEDGEIVAKPATGKLVRRGQL